MIVTRKELEKWLKDRDVTDYQLPTLKRDLIVALPLVVAAINGSFPTTRIVCFQRNPTKYQIREDGSPRPIPTL